MENPIDNQILETIKSGIIDDLENQNNEAAESERNFALAIQVILSQFSERNHQFDVIEIEKLFKALSKTLELAVQLNAQNNFYIRCQRNKIAMAFMYVAQRLSIESVDRLDDFSADIAQMSSKALKYADFALKTASDEHLIGQLQQIYENQILHNHQVCQIAAPIREEMSNETRTEGDYAQLINNLQNPPKESKPTEKSAKILVWIIVIGFGIVLGLAKVFS